MQVKGSDAYRKEKRLMYETLSDVIERMDFASQEKIYYRSALKAMDDYRWPEATDSCFWQWTGLLRRKTGILMN